jgi:uroporphyrinogen decarboxylase
MSPMTGKERLLCALDRGKPDRMPVSLHQWQGYHLDTYLDGITDLEAFARFGMDAQIQYFESMGQFWLVEADFDKFSTPEWTDEAQIVSDDPDDRVVHHVIRTPEGTLTYKTAGDRKTTWITEYLIKRDDDIRLIDKYMPVPDLDLAPIREIYDQVGCWQHACCLMDINELIFKAIDQPDWLHDLLKVLLDKKLRFIESMAGAKFDIVETGGGASSSTVISPKMHEEFCLPYDRRIHDALHDLGFRVTYHTCGGTLAIEDHIVANGCDVSETLAPKSVGSNQEPWDFAEKVGGRIAMIGGVDQHNVVTDGSPETIREMVHKLFETAGADGGYVCSLSDHFFDTALDKLQAFADAGRECVY